LLYIFFLYADFQWPVLQSRLDIEQTRLLVLNAAHQLDLHGNKVARGAIAMAKVEQFLPFSFATLWPEFNVCSFAYSSSSSGPIICTTFSIAPKNLEWYKLVLMRP